MLDAYYLFACNSAEYRLDIYFFLVFLFIQKHVMKQLMIQ